MNNAPSQDDNKENIFYVGEGIPVDLIEDQQEPELRSISLFCEDLISLATEAYQQKLVQEKTHRLYYSEDNTLTWSKVHATNECTREVISQYLEHYAYLHEHYLDSSLNTKEARHEAYKALENYSGELPFEDYFINWLDKLFDDKEVCSSYDSDLDFVDLEDLKDKTLNPRHEMSQTPEILNPATVKNTLFNTQAPAKPLDTSNESMSYPATETITGKRRYNT